jgi:hypothetical protein
MKSKLQDENRINMKSQIQCFYPIVTTLKKIEEFVKENQEWITINSNQKFFKKQFYDILKNGDDIPEITSIANFDVKVINKFLKDFGFDIQLNGGNNKDFFYIASILMMFLTWETLNCEKSSFIYNKKQFQAVYSPTYQFVYTSEYSLHPIIGMTTTDKSYVYMTINEKKFTKNELIEWINDVHKTIIYKEKAPVLFPMIECNKNINIHWLEGMHAKLRNGRNISITKALQQIKFAMNEKGVKLESATAIGVSGCGKWTPIEPVTIDKPFVLWFQKFNTQKPLLYAQFNTDSWKTLKIK